MNPDSVYFNSMKIFSRGKYLSEEQVQEFLYIWNSQPVITAGIKSKIVKSSVFQDKFQASEKEIKDFYSNDIFKRIIHTFNQNLSGY